MKHQITLRRLLLYVALFTVGLGMIRFDRFLQEEELLPGELFFSWVWLFGLYCLVAAVCCPIGYVIAEKGGEYVGVLVSIPVTICLGFAYALSRVYW